MFASVVRNRVQMTNMMEANCSHKKILCCINYLGLNQAESS